MATIQDAADAYANAEQHLRKAQVEILKVAATYKSLNKEGTIGGLEYMVRTATIKALAGQIAEAELAVVVNHADDTERAQELGIDVPAFSGGGDIGIMGGGGR